MGIDRLADERARFIDVIPGGDASREVWDVRREAGARRLEYDAPGGQTFPSGRSGPGYRLAMRSRRPATRTFVSASVASMSVTTFAGAFERNCAFPSCFVSRSS